MTALTLASVSAHRPEVLRDNLMDPIGASRTWRWNGYDNAWITLDGRAVQVVSGGGHWGGGMFINAWDMAPGIILVKEAGGVATSVTGGKLDLHGQNVCVSNGAVQAALIEKLNVALQQDGYR